MIVARRAAVLAVALLLAGCGPSVTPAPATPAPTPTPTPTAAPATIGGYAGAPGSAGIVAPVQAGETLTVQNGYDNPMPSDPCPPKGYGHDHCTNQEYGLDLVPSNLSDLLVLSPVTGKIAWSDVSGGGCLGIVPTAFPQLNLTVCHLSELSAGTSVTAGEVLGLRRAANPWIHMSLDVRVDGNGKAIPTAQVVQGVPFSGPFTIAGHDFPSNATPTFDLHQCESFVSSTTATGDTAEPSPLPAITPSNLVCNGTAVTPTPTPAPLVLSGTWVAPKDGAKLPTSLLTLSAKPTVTPSTLQVAKVAFSIKWGSTTKAACSATKAGSGGVWSCSVDLWKIGAPIGELAVAFDVTDSAGNVAKAPAGTRTVTFAAPPPKPADTSYTLVSSKTAGNPPETDLVYRVRWSEPDGAATSFDIYEVWGCYARKKGDPCVSAGMSIPQSDRGLLATVKGTDREFLYRFTQGVVLEWDNWTKAILVQARNQFGYSKSAIVYTVVCDAQTPCP